MESQTDLQEHAEGWQKDGEDNADDVHGAPSFRS
jgi:hypothetical protein